MINYESKQIFVFMSPMSPEVKNTLPACANRRDEVASTAPDSPCDLGRPIVWQRVGRRPGGAEEANGLHAFRVCRMQSVGGRGI